MWIYHLILWAVMIVRGSWCLGADKGDTVAAKLIPFESMTVSNRAIVKSVTDHYTIRREYAAKRFDAHREHFEFLIDNMDPTSALGQKLGIITYRARLAPDGRLVAENDGARGSIQQVLRADGQRIYYVEGRQSGVFEAQGRGVAVINYSTPATNVVEYSGAIFVKVDNVVFATLTQVFAVFLKGAVDKNFNLIIRHPIRLAEMAQKTPDDILKTISELPAEEATALKPLADSIRGKAGTGILITNTPVNSVGR